MSPELSFFIYKFYINKVEGFVEIEEATITTTIKAMKTCISLSVYFSSFPGYFYLTHLTIPLNNKHALLY